MTCGKCGNARAFMKHGDGSCNRCHVAPKAVEKAASKGGRKACPVRGYKLKGREEHLFGSVKEASEKTGIRKDTIYGIAEGRLTGRNTGWMFGYIPIDRYVNEMEKIDARRNSASSKAWGQPAAGY